MYYSKVEVKSSNKVVPLVNNAKATGLMRLQFVMMRIHILFVTILAGVNYKIPHSHTVNTSRTANHRSE